MLLLALGLSVGAALQARHASAPPLHLDVAVSAPLETGGLVPTTLCLLGSDVVIRASGATALWVYREDVLIASCPGEACRDDRGALALVLRPTVATRHRVVALAGPGDLVSSGRFDRDTLDARTRGARLAIRVFDVMERP